MADFARFVFQGGPAAREAAGRTFGLALPEAACRSNEDAGRAALWLGPDERLLLAPEGAQAEVTAAVEAALADLPHSLVDVSERQVAVRVDGPGAADRLATGCPLDLDADAFPVGMCTRTLFARAEVVLWRRGAEEYHLEVGRSFADYVRGCLRSAQ